MVSREDLKPWVLDALRLHGGKARIVQTAKYIWDTYESDLKRSGDFFYKWQYEMRWAGGSTSTRGENREVGINGTFATYLGCKITISVSS
jgi:hypothetical protein